MSTSEPQSQELNSKSVTRDTACLSKALLLWQNPVLQVVKWNSWKAASEDQDRKWLCYSMADRHATRWKWSSPPLQPIENGADWGTKELILKTIGTRKGYCAWSCSRWQTQPEKICKSQRTNQCHSLRTLYWFVLCNFQIFSGCVCHLEQLHAQSPFLFPIVFSINLIPFFDICSVDLLAVFQPGCSGMCYFTWAAARSQQ